MSATSDLFTGLLTSLGGASAIGIATAKVWAWYTARDARLLADAEARDSRKADAEKSATDKLIAAYEKSAADAEARAREAAEGRAAVARALTETGNALAALAAEVTRVASVIADHDRREVEVAGRAESLSRVLAAHLDEILALQRVMVTKGGPSDSDHK